MFLMTLAADEQQFVNNFLELIIFLHKGITFFQLMKKNGIDSNIIPDRFLVLEPVNKLL